MHIVAPPPFFLGSPENCPGPCILSLTRGNSRLLCAVTLGNGHLCTVTLGNARLRVMFSRTAIFTPSDLTRHDDTEFQWCSLQPQLCPCLLGES